MQQAGCVVVWGGGSSGWCAGLERPALGGGRGHNRDATAGPADWPCAGGWVGGWDRQGEWGQRQAGRWVAALRLAVVGALHLDWEGGG